MSLDSPTPINLNDMVTEQRNTASEGIDQVDTLTMLRIINEADHSVAHSVQRVLPTIAQAVDLITAALQRGGRLIYIGAGTSGRLGVLDASECPPTFGVEPTLVRGIVAGGDIALRNPVENAEDDADAGAFDLEQIRFNESDVLVGIAASGRTPYVIGAMHYAAKLGVPVISISCNPDSPMAAIADIDITLVVGPEVVTGSSRMKAGTAQKMVLNMLSTGAMIKMGKVFGNLMVDVEATNAKLVERQIQIVIAATACTREAAIQALDKSDRHCKTAIVMLKANTDVRTAKMALTKAHGHTLKALTHFIGTTYRVE